MVRKQTTALMEFVAMLAAIVLCGIIASPESPLFLQMRPHPFWIPVLLIAIRYGSPMGAVAGMTCTLIHIGALALGGDRLADLWHLGSAQVVYPLFYFIVGIVVGGSTEWRMRRAEFVTNQLQELRGRLDNSETRRAELEQAYRALEGRIAGETNTVITLYESARRLDAMNEDDIYDGLVEVLKRHLSVEKCGIWEASSDQSFHERGAEDNRGRPLPALGDVVLREGGVVTAREFFIQDQGAAPEDGILAGPLRNPDGSVRAVVVAEEMRFIGFTHTTVKLFELLLEWTNRSLANAMDLQSARTRDVYDMDLDLTSEAFLRTRADEEIALTRRRESTASLLLCRVAGEMPPETYRRILLVVARAFRHETRLSDCLAYFDDDRLFVLFLPDVDTTNAAIVHDKLTQNVRAFDFRPYGDDSPLALQWGVAQLQDDDDFAALFARAHADMEGSAE